MKKTIAVLFTIVFAGATCFAQQPSLRDGESQGPDKPIEEKAPQPGKVENVISAEYGKLLLSDAGHVLSAPFRWNGNDWLLAGAGISAIVVTMAVADTEIENEISEHRVGFNDGFAKALQPFGAEWSLAVLGGFEAAGLIFKDDNARATAQDGLAASIIASGLIATPLKYIFGRNRPNKNSGHGFAPFSGGDSFPSGHTTQAFAVASVIAEHYDSFWAKAAVYGIASAVGYSRIERKDHWASDVLAGALLGTLVGRAIARFNKNKRYQLSIYSDGDTTGIKITHRF